MTAPSGPGITVRHRRDQPHATAGGAGPLLIAPGSSTGGEFGLFEIEIAPGGGTDGCHFHTGFTESFYVLDGEVCLLLDDGEHVASQGDFAFVPRHAVHGFRNDDDEQSARMLILFTPGVAREDYFREMAELHEREPHPTAAEIDAIAVRHDQVNLRDDA